MSTGLDRLRSRLQQARSENYLDLRPPAKALDGLYVRCRALRPDELSATLERHAGSKEVGVHQALDVLVSTCVGVWEEVDGKGVSPIDGYSGVIDLKTGVLSGDLPKFSDPDLAEALGVADGTAAAACRALLAPVSDLSLMNYADAVSDFSTAANIKVTRDAPGNS